MIKDLSNKLKKDIYFLYNNLHRDSIIDEDFSYYICRMIQENKNFDDSLILLHSKGGNLKSGAKISDFIRKTYKDVSYYVPERSGSTSTLMVLTGDKVYLNDASIVTPCEPQIDTTTGDKISVSDFRNYLEHHSQRDINFVDLAKYYSTIKYFKDLCRKIYDEKTCNKIIEFMLNEINSHDYLLSIEEFIKMGVTLGNLKDLPIAELNDIHDTIKNIQRMELDHIGTVLLGPDMGYVFRKELGDDRRKIKEEYERVESSKILTKRRY